MTSVNLPRTKRALCTLAAFWEFPTSVITSYNTEGAVKLFVSKDIFTNGSDSGKESSWRIVVNPCYMENGKRYISMHMRLTGLKTANDNNKYIDTLCEISLLHPETKFNSIFRADTFCRRLTLENNQIGWNKFMEYTQLGPDPHPTMYIYIELNIFGDPKTIPIFSTLPSSIQDQKNEVVKQEEQEEPVGNEMQKLVVQANKMKWDRRETGAMDNADLHIHTAGKTHLAHSSVLKVQSQKITKMLQGSTLSAKEPYHLLYPEWPDECIEAVLEFCYTGNMTKFIPELETLWKFAELSASLQIDDLAQLAREMVLLRTDADNFYEVLLAIIQINTVRVDNLRDSEAHLREKLNAYTIQDLFRELLSLRPKYPSIISDYNENLDKYAVLLFELPFDSEDEDTSDYESDEEEEEEDLYQ